MLRKPVAYAATFVGLLAFLVATPVDARLPKISFEEFLASARCGYIVEVRSLDEHPRSTEELEAEVARTGRIILTPNVQVRMTVDRAFGSLEGCHDHLHPGTEFTMWFFSETHSSHPTEGERAIVFPSERDHQWLEAVFGSSYWPIWPDSDPPAIVVNWRNDFLRDRLPVKAVDTRQFAETGAAKVEDIIEAWGGELR